MTSFSLIGNKPFQVPTNGDLGRLAFLNYVGLEDFGSSVQSITAITSTTISVTSKVMIIDVASGVISTISVPGEFINGGQITLIPKQAFSTNTTGNIAVATTAEVSRPLTFIYESVAGKWYPSYVKTGVYTSDNLSVFANTTSAQLAGVISDETGYTSNAKLMFNVMPAVSTSITSDSASFDLINNSTAASVYIAGNATTLKIGHTTTAATTVDFVTGATAATTTKTINIGTGGISTSTTNITLGSAVSGALGTTTINNKLSVASEITTAATTFTLLNTATQIDFGGAATAINVGSTTASSAVNFKCDITAKGNITAYYTSDKRLKDNITPITNPLEKLLKLSGNTFKWTDEHYATQNPELVKEYDVGVVAQEVQAVLPEAVHERDNGMLAVDYQKLIPLLIECIKAQQIQIDELKGNK
jgi:hypothetical protein